MVRSPRGAWARRPLRLATFLFIDPVVPVLGVIAAGLVLTWLHHPRGGMYFVAAGLGLGTLLRAFLPGGRSGLLAVRGRAFDTVALGALCVGVVVLASLTTFPPPNS